MTDFPNRIIQILRGCPNGLTSKDIAERLGTTRRNLSSRLSKLAAYGIIGQVRGSVAEHGTKGAIYRANAADGPMAISPKYCCGLRDTVPYVVRE
jgi:DNA-binding Lrp family transcriptional regulator